MLASSLSRRLRWSRIVFLYGVQSFSSEFGERTRITLVQQVRSSEKEGVNPGLAGSEFGERPVPFSELWQVRSWHLITGRNVKDLSLENVHLILFIQLPLNIR